MKVFFLLFIAAMCIQLHAENLGQPEIHLSTRQDVSGLTILDASTGPLSGIAGLQFDILIPASHQHAIDTSACNTNTENLNTENLLVSCNAAIKGNYLRIRYIIASLTHEPLPVDITVSSVTIRNQDLPQGTFTALLDPCTSTYANSSGSSGQFAVGDMYHAEITKPLSVSALQSESKATSITVAQKLWSNNFGPALSAGNAYRQQIQTSAPQWSDIPRFISLKLPGENEERLLAVHDVRHGKPGSNRSACEIGAVSGKLQSLGKGETVHLQANGEDTYLSLTFTKSGMRGFVSGQGVAYKINVLDNQYWLLKPETYVNDNDVEFFEPNPESASQSSSMGFVCPNIPRFDPIDIAVFYTAAAEATVIQAGGNIEDEIQTLVAQTSTALSNSVTVPVNMNPIAIRMTDFIEPGDNIFGLLGAFSVFLRDTNIPSNLSTDIIALIADVSGSNFCDGRATGVHDFNRILSLQNELISVTTVECLSDVGMIFSHEVGHTLGGHHNPDSTAAPPPPPPPPFDDTTAPFPWSFGHWFIDSQPNDGYSTIMSDRSLCSSVTGLFCTTVPFYSTPNITFVGQPLGIPDERDNARGFDCTVPHIALRRTPPEDILIDGFEAHTL